MPECQRRCFADEDCGRHFTAHVGCATTGAKAQVISARLARPLKGRSSTALKRLTSMQTSHHSAKRLRAALTSHIHVGGAYRLTLTPAAHRQRMSSAEDQFAGRVAERV